MAGTALLICAPPGDFSHHIHSAISAGSVIDLFSGAGLKRPDISILSDEFLAEVWGMPQRNLAVELRRKLLSGELKTRARKSLVLSRRFSEMLDAAVRKHHRRAIETAQAIEELIALAKDMRAAEKRGEELNLSGDEVAFHYALKVNDSAVAVLGDENLRTTARELADALHENTSVD